MAKDEKPAVPLSVPRSHGNTGPKTAGMRPFDAAGQYGRQEKPEDAARLPGLSAEQYQEHVVEYHERLKDYTTKARGAEVPNMQNAASAGSGDAAGPASTATGGAGAAGSTAGSGAASKGRTR